MPGSKKPKKKYRPKPVVVNSLQLATERLSGLSEHSRHKLLIRAYTALEELTHGQGTKSSWNTLTAALNVSVVICEGIPALGLEHRSILKQAQEAHAQCGRRFVRGGRFGYTGQELESIRVAIDIHEQQLALVTVGEMERVYAEVMHRLATGKIDYIVVKPKTAEIQT